jgi:hypothetical protein
VNRVGDIVLSLLTTEIAPGEGSIVLPFNLVVRVEANANLSKISTSQTQLRLGRTSAVWGGAAETRTLFIRTSFDDPNF